MKPNQRERYNVLGTNENKKLIIEGVANLGMTVNESFEMLNKKMGHISGDFLSIKCLKKK